MKNKIAIASAFFAASSLSFAEIALTENLSVEGFVNMSYSHTEDDAQAADETGNNYSLDQVEISFLLDFDAVGAQIDLQWVDVGGASVDQAFTTYSLSNGIVVTAGRYDSMLGFEAFEPTGLFQDSKAYESDTEVLIDANITYSDLITPGTNNGVKVSYETETDFFGISLQDGAFFGDGRLGGDNDNSVQAFIAQVTQAPDVDGGRSGYAIEAAYAKDLGNGFNAFLGAVFEETEAVIAGADLDIESTVYNAYITYETGAWLFAAEYTITEHAFDLGFLEADIDVDSALVMANYSYSDQASITGRISHVDADDLLEATKFTLAHSYAFTDNLLLVAEVSAVEYEFEAGGDGETLEGALSLLFTF